MIKLSNIRIGETTKTVDRVIPYYFTPALVDITKYSFRFLKRVEKDVPVLCEWYSFMTSAESWIRVDTQEILPYNCSCLLQKAVQSIENQSKIAESISRYEALKSNKL